MIIDIIPIPLSQFLPNIESNLNDLDCRTDVLDSIGRVTFSEKSSESIGLSSIGVS